MSMGIKKTVVGLTVSLFLVEICVPVAFWFVAIALDRALGLRMNLPEPVPQILSATCLLIGVFWISWAYSYLVFVGEGLPLEVFGRALHPTRILVTTGPYAYVRNPMLLGLLFVLFGVAFLGRSTSGLILTPIIGVAAIVHMVEFEEKGLARRFGADYEEYRRNVRAIFPHLRPYIHEPVAAA